MVLGEVQRKRRFVSELLVIPSKGKKPKQIPIKIGTLKEIIVTEESFKSFAWRFSVFTRGIIAVKARNKSRGCVGKGNLFKITDRIT